MNLEYLTGQRCKELAETNEFWAKAHGIILMNASAITVQIKLIQIMASKIDPSRANLDDISLLISAFTSAYLFTEGLVSYQARERVNHFSFSILEKLTGTYDLFLTRASTYRAKAKEYYEALNRDMDKGTKED